MFIPMAKKEGMGVILNRHKWTASLKRHQCLYANHLFSSKLIKQPLGINNTTKVKP